MLYEFQVVPPGTPFAFSAVMENAENWELGLLMLGLNQFRTQQIPLGGGRSRGLGVVELNIEKMLWSDMRSPDSEDIDPERVLAYIQGVATRQATPADDITDQETLHDSWVAALIAHLRTSATAMSAQPLL